MVRTSAKTSFLPSLPHHRPTATHRTLARWRSLSHSAVDLDKAELETIPPALPVHHNSAQRPTDPGPQEPSAVPHPDSGIARTNREKVSVVPAAPSVLPSSSQTFLSSLTSMGLISSRTRRRQAATACKPPAAVGYGFARLHSTLPTVHDQPQPRASRARLGLPCLQRHLPGPPSTHLNYIDSTRHRCRHTCSTPAWCTPSRCSSAC